jgi:hypothetical protein
VEIEADFDLTPKQVAQAFWELSDTEQAQFFAELHDITKDIYAGSELQWCYMSQEIEKNPKAKLQACRMMVWIFNRATDFLSRQPEIPYIAS